jgi:hypothetical protein
MDLDFFLIITGVEFFCWMLLACIRYLLSQNLFSMLKS